MALASMEVQVGLFAQHGKDGNAKDNIRGYGSVFPGLPGISGLRSGTDDITVIPRSLCQKVHRYKYELIGKYREHIWVFPKIRVTPPNHQFGNRVWNHYFHHPFCGFLGAPIFGSTPISYDDYDRFGFKNPIF